MSTLDAVVLLRRALVAMFYVSLAGVAFSGALTLRELTGGPVACTVGGSGGAGGIFGVPVCVYGLAMYLLMAPISGTALIRTRPGAAAGNSLRSVGFGVPGVARIRAPT